MIECKTVFTYFKSTFLFITLMVFLSCSLSKKTENTKTNKNDTDIQRHDTLVQGVSFFEGDGSEQNPFIILVDENVSDGGSLELSSLFVNVVDVEQKSIEGPIELNLTSKSIVAEPGSKLSIKLSGASDEKYAEFYFQDSARLTDAVQVGEAILRLGSRGKVTTGSEEVDVTLYRKSDSAPYSVELKSLFNYDEQNFDISAFKENESAADRAVSFNLEEALDLSVVTPIEAEQTLFLVEFKPKEGVDALLHPSRSQILRISTDEQVMSSLAFNEAAWDEGLEGLTSGESPAAARLIESLWNETLNLPAYFIEREAQDTAESVIKRKEPLQVKLYRSNDVEIFRPKNAGGGSISRDEKLDLPVVFGTDQGNYTFDISKNPASAVFEFIGSGEIEKKLYIKVLLSAPLSPIDKTDEPISNLSLVSSNANGSIDDPYEFSVAVQEIELSQLVKDVKGTLTFAVRKAGTETDFTPLSDPTFASPGSEDGGVRSWLFRAKDSTSIKYKEKFLYFKLNFPEHSSLSARIAYQDENDGSRGTPIEVSVPVEGLTLADLTVPNGRSLVYRIDDRGSALSREGAISDSFLHIGLNVDDNRDGDNILERGYFVLSVFDAGDVSTPAKTLYFRLFFEDASPVLRANINYPITPSYDGSLYSKPIIVPQVVEGASLTLANLIAGSAGEVRYSLLRQGEAPIPLDVAALKVGDQIDTFTVGGGEWIIRAVDVSPEGAEMDELYFRISFRKGVSTLKTGDIVTIAGKTGKSVADAFVLTLPKDTELALGALTQSHAGQLSYVIDGVEDVDATLSTVLQVGNRADNATRVFVDIGEHIIRVTDTGNEAVLPKTLYFEVGFKLDPTLKKDEDIITQGGDGSAENPYRLASVTAEQSLNLASLTTDPTSEDSRRYYLDASETALSSSIRELSLGTFGSVTVTAGEHIIKVEDVGSATVLPKTIYFKLIFQSASTLEKDDNLQVSGGEGTFESPYQLQTLNPEEQLILATLTQNPTSESSREYYLDSSAEKLDSSIEELKLRTSAAEPSNNELEAGPHSIRVYDVGSDIYSTKSIYFEVSFKYFSELKKHEDLVIEDGDGSLEEPYRLGAVDSTSFLLFDSLFQDSTSQNNIEYYVNNSDALPSTVSRISASSPYIAAGTDHTIRIKDAGDTRYLPKTIYFKTIFTAPSPLEKHPSISENGNDGSSETPYRLTVSHAESLLLENLIQSDETLGDRITYYWNDSETALTVSEIQLGDEQDTSDTMFVDSGIYIMRVSDSGNLYIESRELYFEITFTATPSSLNKKSDSKAYSFGIQSGLISSRPIQVKFAGPLTPPIAPRTLINLHHLITGSTGEAFFFTVIEEEGITVETLIENPGEYITSTESVKIVVRDQGSNTVDAGRLYLELIVAASQLTVNRNSVAYSFGDEIGTAADPVEVRLTVSSQAIAIAPGTEISLEDLISNAAGATSFSTVASDNSEKGITAATYTPATAGDVTIVVRDQGDATVARGELYLKLIVAASKLTVKRDNQTYHFGELDNASIEVRIARDYIKPVALIPTPIAPNTEIILNDLISAAGTPSFYTTTQDEDGTILVGGLISANSDGNTRYVPTLPIGSNTGTTEVTLLVRDSGNGSTAAGELYLKFIVANAQLKRDMDGNYHFDGQGVDGEPFEVRVAGEPNTPIASGTTINLNDLLTQSSGKVLFSVVTVQDGLITENAVENPNEYTTPTPENETDVTSVKIVVRDQGSATVAKGELYFSLIVAASQLAVNEDSIYAFGRQDETAPEQEGTFDKPFEVRVAGEPNTPIASATLLDLNNLIVSAGELSFFDVVSSASGMVITDPGKYLTPTPENETDVTSVKIVVRDQGSATVAKGELYLKLIVANTTLLKGDSTTYKFGGEDGTATTPIEIRLADASNKAIAIAPNTKIALNDLIKASTGRASFFTVTVDEDGEITARDLISSDDNGITHYTTTLPAAGKTGVTIMAREQGSESVAAGEIYFKLIVANVTLTKGKSATYSYGEQAGTATAPVEVRFAGDPATPLTPGYEVRLVDLVSGNVGETSYATVANDKTETTITGTYSIATSGTDDVTIVVRDKGNESVVPGEIYLQLIVATATLSKGDNAAYSYGDQPGTSGAPFQVRLAGDPAPPLRTGSPVDLALLIKGATGETSYARLDNDDEEEPLTGTIYTTPSSAGNVTIVVRDQGSATVAKGELYLQLIVANATLSKGDNEAYSYGNQAGTASEPVQLRLAGTPATPLRTGSPVTLADLIKSNTGAASFATVANNGDETAITTYTTPSSAGNVTIVVRDQGSATVAKGEIYLQLIVANATLSKGDNEAYSYGNQAGTASEPVQLRLAGTPATPLRTGSPVTLAHLIKSNTGAASFATVANNGDETAITTYTTPSSAGNVTIVVRDKGSASVAPGELYLQLIVANATLSKGDNEAYSYGNQAGTASAPVQLRLAGTPATPLRTGSPVTLADLIKSNTGAASFATVANNGDETAITTYTTPSSAGNVTIVVRDQGSASVAPGELYLQLIVANATLSKGDNEAYSYGNQAGTASEPVQLRLAGTPATPLRTGSPVTLADLIKSNTGAASFATVANNGDETAITTYTTPSSAGNVTIVVRDQGSATVAKGEIYLQLIVANATLSKGDNEAYSYGNQAGTASAPVQLRLAGTPATPLRTGSPVTLAHLIKSNTGAASFATVANNGDETAITTYTTPSSAGNVTIVVRDQGSATVAKGEIYLQLIVANATLSKGDNEAYSYGNQAGTASAPVQLRLAGTPATPLRTGSPVTLAHLIKSNTGAASFATVANNGDETAITTYTTPSSAGNVTIVVRDQGSATVAPGEIYLQLIVANATLSKGDNEAYSYGNQAGTASEPVQLRLAGTPATPLRTGSPVTLAHLIKSNTGAASFATVANNGDETAITTYTTPSSAGNVTIVVRDQGSASVAPGELYLQLIVATATLSKGDNEAYSYGNQAGTASEPVQLRLAGTPATPLRTGSPVTLAHLIKSNTGAASFATVANNGDETAITTYTTPSSAGNVTIVVRDQGSATVAPGEIYLQLIVANATLSKGDNEAYSYGNQAGTASAPVQLRLAGTPATPLRTGSPVTLAHLIKSNTGAASFATVANNGDETAITTYTTPSSAGNVTIVVRDQGSATVAPGELYLQLIVANATLSKGDNEAYSYGNQAGTASEPVQLRLAGTPATPLRTGSPVTLAHLIKSNTGAASFATVANNGDETAITTYTTPSSAGNVTIVVRDQGSATVAPGEIYLQLIVATATLSKGDNEAYSYGNQAGTASAPVQLRLAGTPATPLRTGSPVTLAHLIKSNTGAASFATVANNGDETAITTYTTPSSAGNVTIVVRDQGSATVAPGEIYLQLIVANTTLSKGDNEAYSYGNQAGTASEPVQLRLAGTPATPLRTGSPVTLAHLIKSNTGAASFATVANNGDETAITTYTTPSSAGNVTIVVRDEGSASVAPGEIYLQLIVANATLSKGDNEAYSYGNQPGTSRNPVQVRLAGEPATPLRTGSLVTLAHLIKSNTGAASFATVANNGDETAITTYTTPSSAGNVTIVVRDQGSASVAPGELYLQLIVANATLSKGDNEAYSYGNQPGTSRNPVQVRLAGEPATPLRTGSPVTLAHLIKSNTGAASFATVANNGDETAITTYTTPSSAGNVTIVVRDQGSASVAPGELYLQLIVANATLSKGDNEAYSYGNQAGTASEPVQLRLAGTPATPLRTGSPVTLADLIKSNTGAASFATVANNGDETAITTYTTPSSAGNVTIVVRDQGSASVAPGELYLQLIVANATLSKGDNEAYSYGNQAGTASEPVQLRLAGTPATPLRTGSPVTLADLIKSNTGAASFATVANNGDETAITTYTTPSSAGNVTIVVRDQGSATVAPGEIYLQLIVANTTLSKGDNEAYSYGNQAGTASEPVQLRLAGTPATPLRTGSPVTLAHLIKSNTGAASFATVANNGDETAITTYTTPSSAGNVTIVVRDEGSASVAPGEIYLQLIVANATLSKGDNEAYSYGNQPGTSRNPVQVRLAGEPATPLRTGSLVTLAHLIKSNTGAASFATVANNGDETAITTYTTPSSAGNVTIVVRDQGSASVAPGELYLQLIVANATLSKGDNEAYSYGNQPGTSRNPVQVRLAGEPATPLRTGSPVTLAHLIKSNTGAASFATVANNGDETAITTYTTPSSAGNVTIVVRDQGSASVAPGELYLQLIVANATLSKGDNEAYSYGNQAGTASEPVQLRLAGTPATPLRTGSPVTLADLIKSNTGAASFATVANNGDETAITTYTTPSSAGNVTIVVRDQGSASVAPGELYLQLIVANATLSKGDNEAYSYGNQAGTASEPVQLRLAGTPATPLRTGSPVTLADLIKSNTGAASFATVANNGDETAITTYTTPSSAGNVTIVVRDQGSASVAPGELYLQLIVANATLSKGDNEAYSYGNQAGTASEPVQLRLAGTPATPLRTGSPVTLAHLIKSNTGAASFATVANNGDETAITTYTTPSSAGNVTIVVRDQGSATVAPGEIYLQLIVATATLSKGDNEAYSYGNQAGTASEPVQLRLAGTPATPLRTGSPVTLADLIKSNTGAASFATVANNGDETAITTYTTPSSAGNVTIVVRDQGSATVAPGEIYLQLIVATATLSKGDNEAYSYGNQAGTASEPVQLRLAGTPATPLRTGSPVTLAHLIKSNTGAASFATVANNGDETAITTYTTPSSAGNVTIVVRDKGSASVAPGELYLQLIVANATLSKGDNEAYSYGNQAGTASEPVQLRLAGTPATPLRTGSPVTLAELIKSNTGAASFATVANNGDETAITTYTTPSSAGNVTIVVRDEGSATVAPGELYLQLIVANATLSKGDNEAYSYGNQAGTASEPVQLRLAGTPATPLRTGSLVTLADLIKSNTGAASFATVANNGDETAITTYTTPSSAGNVTIVVRDQGSATVAPGELYLQLIVANATLSKGDNEAYSYGNQAGTASEPVQLRLAGTPATPLRTGSPVTLAELIKSNTGAASFATVANNGDETAITTYTTPSSAGNVTIVVRDQGSATVAPGEIYLQLIVATATLSKGDNEAYSYGNQAGTASEPVQLRLAGTPATPLRTGSPVTLADLIKSNTGAASFATVANNGDETAITTYTTPSSAGNVTIVVRDQGSATVAPGEIYLQLIVANATLSKGDNEAYSYGNQAGTASEPVQLRLAGTPATPLRTGSPVTLAELIKSNTGAASFATVANNGDETAITTTYTTPSSAGNVTIVVRDQGSASVAPGEIYLQLIVANATLSKGDNAAYSYGNQPGTSRNPVQVRLAGEPATPLRTGSPVTLAHLIKSNTGAASFATVANNGDETAITTYTTPSSAGNVTIVVRDKGSASVAPGELYLQLIVANATLSKGDNEAYSYGNQAGTASEPVQLRLAGTPATPLRTGSPVTLAELIKSNTGAASFATVANNGDETAITTYTTPSSAGNVTIVVRDQGSASVAPGELYLQLIVANATLSKGDNEAYSYGNQAGTASEPVQLRLAGTPATPLRTGSPVTLAHLIKSNTGAASFATVANNGDETAITTYTTPSSAGNVTIVVRDKGSASVAPGELYLQLIVANATLSKGDNEAYSYGNQAGTASEPVQLRLAGTPATPLRTGSPVTLADLIQSNTGAASYFTLDSDNKEIAIIGTTYTTPSSAGNVTIVVRDKGSASVAPGELYVELIVATATLSKGNNAAYSYGNQPGTSRNPVQVRLAGEPATPLRTGSLVTLADLIQSNTGAASYFTLDSDNKEIAIIGTTYTTPSSAGNVTIVVRDKGSDSVAPGELYVQLIVATASLTFNDQLPLGYKVTGGGADFANAAILTVSDGTLPANTAVDLTAFFKDFAAPSTNRVYETVTSANDQLPGTISNPADALADQAGTSVVVKVTDPGSAAVARKTLYLSLAFAPELPTADGRYTPALLRGGPEVQLTGSMTAGEISFSVELQPNKVNIIYSVFYNSREFTLFNENGLNMYHEGTGAASNNLIAGSDFPPGTYNFTLRKTPSANGYTVTILVDGQTPNNNTFEITTDFDAFFNPVIGASPDGGSNRRPVRVVNNVQWAFQPAAPLVSLFGGNDFSPLTNNATVGSTFVVRVPDLVAGDRFELFSVTGSAEKSLGTKTVSTDETSLEFEVSDLTHGTVYEFLVKPADSSANLLDSPHSVAVSVDTSVPATTAAFLETNRSPVLQNQVVNGFTFMSVSPVDSANAFRVGDRIFLYEIKNTARVAVGSATGLVHTFTTENLEQSPIFDLSGVTFEERAYALVVEVVTPLGNTADSNFGLGSSDRVFDITFDYTPPQLSFNFMNLTTLSISANEDLVGNDVAGDIQGGLTFTGSDPNPTVSNVTHNATSGVYTVILSQSLAAGAVLNFAGGTVSDVVGNGNVGIQQTVLPSLRSIVASSNRIDANSTSTSLTFNFTQEIDASSFTADDLEFVAASGSVSGLSFGSVVPSTGASRTISVPLNAPSGFDNQVSVRMKADNQIFSPASPSLVTTVAGESPPIDIDLKAPTPTVSFTATEVGLSTAIGFTLSFDEAVTGDIEDTDFTAAAGGSITDISRTDESTFTGTLTTPSTATNDYSLRLNVNVLADAYGNNNIVSVPATIDVVSDAVPVPSFSSAPPLARHGGSTTLTISFTEVVTGFELSDLGVTDAGGNADTVVLSNFSPTENDGKVYTVTLTTKNTWTSGAVTVTVAANAYQDALLRGNTPLTYTISVNNALTVPTLVSVTDGTTTVAESSDRTPLLLNGIKVKVGVSAVAGDNLLLFLDNQQVAAQLIQTTGTQESIITAPDSETNGSRPAYSVRLQDAQGNTSESSRVLSVSFADPNVLTAPKITGPVANVDFSDNFSSGSSSWTLKSGKDFPDGPGSAAITDGVLVLNDLRKWQHALATQNDLKFSTQGRVVFEGTFIFGDNNQPADGMAFFAYDAQDELFYEGRTYSGNNNLVVTNKRLRSLFFAVGLLEYRHQGFAYAAPGMTAADLTDLSNPSGGNESGWERRPEWNKTFARPGAGNTAYRLRITLENRIISVEHARFGANGVVDESSWTEVFSDNIGASNAYIPDNIKIGFSSATGDLSNYHAVDDLSVSAELFVPYTVGASSTQAIPRGVTLDSAQQGEMILDMNSIHVEISEGYRVGDILSFRELTDFEAISSDTTLIIKAKDPNSPPSTEEFLTALKAVHFSAEETGERTLSWQVFAHTSSNEEIGSSLYSSQVKVFPQSSNF